MSNYGYDRYFLEESDDSDTIQKLKRRVRDLEDEISGIDEQISEVKKKGEKKRKYAALKAGLGGYVVGNIRGSYKAHRYYGESTEDYIDGLLDNIYEAYYYDLLDDAEYEAFVESVYEADDMNDIYDVENVFESYI